MSCPRVVIGAARVSIANAEGQSHRAENISRLTFEYLQQLIERELQHLRADISLANLQVPAMNISLDDMGDEEIARLNAEGIFKALLQVLQ